MSASALLGHRLRPGDRVAVVSPSGDLAGRYPARLSHGLAALRSLGLDPVPTPHAVATDPSGVLPREQRAADLNAAFGDDDVRGVFCAIGGRGATDLLDLVDYDQVRRTPKVFCGYSDATALHAALHAETGLVTFYGPSVLMELGDSPAPFPETVTSLRAALCDPAPLGVLPVFEDIVVEGTDWVRPHARRRRPAPEQVVVRRGVGTGRLVGGCLPVLARLVGTPWEPRTRDAVLVLETPQAPYDLVRAAADLWQLSHAGLLDGLAGLVVGWPFSLDQVEGLVAAVRDALPPDADHPVVIGFPTGHTSPFVTLPLGAHVRLDDGALSVLTPATRGT